MIGYKVKKIKYTDRKYEGTKKRLLDFIEENMEKENEKINLDRKLIIIKIEKVDKVTE